jgi:uncharacterized phage infection (PIP) family protein YhgE
MCEDNIARPLSEAHSRIMADAQQQFRQELQLLETRLMWHIDRQVHAIRDLSRRVDQLDAVQPLIHAQLERTEALCTQVTEQLQQYGKDKETAHQDLEQKLDDLQDTHNGLERHLEDLQSHLEDHLDQEMESQTTSAKIDLQEFVQGEVQNAQEVVEQKLQDGVFMIGGMVQISR